MHRRAVVVSATAVVCIPLVVALVDLRSPSWHPVVDWAQLEMRVRDVFSSDPPLVGLAGRLYWRGERGSHPGPLAFYALAPVYRLLGGSSFALLVSTTAVNALALGTAVWLGVRRLGALRGAVLVGAGVALLVHAYGTARIDVPWNPWLPILWWFVFLLAVWSVLCDDVPMLPVAVVAGTFCMQTHVSYLGQVVGLLLLAAGAVVVRVVRGHGDDAWLRSVRRWSIAAGALLALLWLPVLLEELQHDPGNLSIVVGQFTDSEGGRAPFGDAVGVWLSHLHPIDLVAGHERVDGASLVGVLVLATWATAVVAAVRWGSRSLVALHVVVGAALVLGLVSTASIVGFVVPYLLLWSWGTLVLLLGGVAGSAMVVARRYAPDAMDSAARPLLLGVGAVAVVLTVASTLDGGRAHTPFEGLSYALDRTTPAVVDAIESGAVAGDRFSVSWTNDADFAWLAPYGLLLELDRAGVDVTMTPEHTVTVGAHNVAPLGDVDTVLTYVTGDAAIARWRDDGDAVEVVHVPASAADAAERATSRVAAIDGLQAFGRPDLAGLVDVNLWGLSLEPGLPDALRERLTHMLDLSIATSVFATPAG